MVFARSEYDYTTRQSVVIIVTAIELESHSPRIEDYTFFICELLNFISNLPYDDYI